MLISQTKDKRIKWQKCRAYEQNQSLRKVAEKNFLKLWQNQHPNQRGRNRAEHNKEANQHQPWLKIKINRRIRKVHIRSKGQNRDDSVVKEWSLTKIRRDKQIIEEQRRWMVWTRSAINLYQGGKFQYNRLKLNVKRRKCLPQQIHHWTYRKIRKIAKTLGEIRIQWSIIWGTVAEILAAKDRVGERNPIALVKEWGEILCTESSKRTAEKGRKRRALVSRSDWNS